MTETTTPAPRALVSWSGGKDGALALHDVLAGGDLRVDGLLTTVTEGDERVSAHGIPLALVEEQARAIGLPLRVVRIPPACPNDAYEAALRAALAAYAAEGGEAVVFGDLHLADVRAYRERLVRGLPLRAAFPLWGADPAALARRFVALGFRATLVCVDPRQLDRALCGRELDADLLADLPAGADPCGENGEYHTFVRDGPIFARPVRVAAGGTVERHGFVFHELVAAG